MKNRILGILALAGIGLAAAHAQTTEWKDWGGDSARRNYSPLSQIAAANVAGLKPVWVWDSGKFGRSWETRPLLIDGLLYLTESQSGDTIALEPETGKLVWRAKPPVTAGAGLNRRSFAYWGGDGAMKPRLVAVWGHKIFGYDLKTGQQVSDWPATGLEIGLPNPAEGGKIGGGVQSNSPPIIYKNMIITMGATGFLPPPAQPGDPHANDLRTGKLLWTARVVPRKGEPGGDSWGPETDSVVSMGGWGHMALDEASGTVYVPTDSPSPDYVGIWRPGDNIGSGSTVAIDAATGKVKWRFQEMHHAIFDLDTNAAPAPVEITKDGKRMKVVVQATKQAMIWILDAETGKPIHPYEERAVAQSQVPGEKSSPTQPFTIKPPPLIPATVKRDQLSQLSAQANEECKALFDERKLSDVGPFSVPVGGGVWALNSIGAIGGMDWGGVSIDPERGYAFANVDNMPTMITGDADKRWRSKAMAACTPMSAMCASTTRAAAAAMAACRASWSPSIWDRARSSGACRSARWKSRLARAPRTWARPALARPWRPVAASSSPPASDNHFYARMTSAPANCCGRPRCRRLPMRGR